MESITINIFEHSEGGYQYDIYEHEGDLEDGKDPLDGGLCTSTIENALGMAHEQALALIAKRKQK